MQLIENDNTTNVPGRPASPSQTAAQTMTPFLSLGPVVGLEAAGASQITTPFSSLGPVAPAAPQTTISSLSSGSVAHPELCNYRTTPAARFNGLSSPPTSSSYPVQGSRAYQLMLTPQFSSTTQPVPPLGGPPPIGTPMFTPPGSLHPHPQIPLVLMGHQVETASLMPSGGNMPPPLLEPSFPAPRPSPQPPSHGYPIRLPRGTMLPLPSDPQFPAPRSISQTPLQAYPATNVPSGHAPFHFQRGSFVPPLPIGASVGYSSREQMQHPTSGPPLGGTLQGLVEEFQSLSLGSAAGSVDSGIDPKSLPRPFHDDVEPISILETYPLNCHPRYLRLTTHAIPSSQSLLARWHLPLGAVVHPLAEAPDMEEVPIVDSGPAGVVRCRRCRAYMNPYVTFIDAGRMWRCSICCLHNEVPGEYFCGLDANGRRLDVDQRPELSKGSVEFITPAEYMVRPPMPPVYFFLIDVSVSAVQCGLLEIVAKTIKSCLDELPGFPRTQIGFLTFDSTLHFYSLKSSLTQPQMMVVTDLDNIFLPSPDDLLVNLSDSRSIVDAFLDSLPHMFQDNANVESAFGPALKSAFMVMSQLGGKLLVFLRTLPSLGFGRLKLRGDDLRVYGTDKEHTSRIPEDPFYKQMAAEFTGNQIAVDIYAFNDKYSDLASLGSLAKYTGGQVYYYPSFQAGIHKERFRYDLARDLTRETAWEALLRIRCSKGVRCTAYHGHFMLSSTWLLSLPAVDCDKAIGLQLSLEDNLMTSQIVYFQFALLYTSSLGERRVRVHTAAVPVVTDLGEMYRNADTGAIVSLLSRIAIENTLSHKLEDVRQLLQLKIIKSLKEYRNLYVVQHRLGGRLIFPESLKFLPLYVLSLCKSAALCGGYADAPLDEPCAAGYSMMILSVRRMLKLLYPSLIRIDGNLVKAPHIADDFGELSKQLALTAESFDPSGLYIYDDGFNLITWFGRTLSSDVVVNILGTGLSDLPDLSKAELCEHDNEVSRKLMKVLAKLREKDPFSHQSCHLIRQDERPRECSLLLSRLIEDQTPGTSSYVNWILQIFLQSQRNP